MRIVNLHGLLLEGRGSPNRSGTPTAGRERRSHRFACSEAAAKSSGDDVARSKTFDRPPGIVYRRGYSVVARSFSHGAVGPFCQAAVHFAQ